MVAPPPCIAIAANAQHNHRVSITGGMNFMQSNSDITSAEEIGAHDVWDAILENKRWVLSASLVAACAAFGVSYLVKPVYKADVLLSPAQNPAGMSGGKSSMAGQLGGLASIAGLASQDTPTTQVYLATLKSRLLTEQFVKEKNLLPVLFAADWDSGTGTWKSSVKKPPTLWDANRLFEKSIRTVVEDKKTSLITMVIAWGDPTLAASWANELVARTNTFLRTVAVERSSRNLRYLQQQLEKTSVIEVRQSIDNLIENEIKTLTLAEGADEYAFWVIDPAVVPEKRSSPDRILFAVGGLALGFICGTLFALFGRRAPAAHCRRTAT